VEGGIHGRKNARLRRIQGMTEGGIHAGRVALVTGAGRGIGAATARLLAREGATVSLDVADEDSVWACFERVQGELGNVTILINNAGTPGIPLPVAATRPDAWRRAFDVNVTGAFLCAREALPGMVSANWGRIVNVSSAAARHPAAWPRREAGCPVCQRCL
jgi:NAD(P)-dependent dehydrogenase (short-subunit alcohol dehydrogenase family)